MIVRKPDAEKFLGKKLKGRKTDWYVLSATGEKNLGGPYSKKDAKKRLGQVEFFKRHGNPDDAIRNATKPFLDRKHDWNEVLIQKGNRKFTRKQILNYYKRNTRKIWPFLEGQTAMVYIAPKKNEFVLRRKGPSGEYIKLTKLKGIDDPHSYEYWINRRVIEFHVVLTKETTPIIWADLDMHSTTSPQARRRLLGKMKRAVPRIKKVFKKLGVVRAFAYSSGEDGGVHVEGQLSRPKNVDKIRQELTEMLRVEFEGDKIFTTGLAKKNEIRIDTSTLHKLGSLRAPWSFTRTGSSKKRIT